jgi:hypothetical protein
METGTAVAPKVTHIFHLNVGIDPIAVATDGLLRGTSITVSGTAKCVTETIGPIPGQHSFEDTPDDMGVRVDLGGHVVGVTATGPASRIDGRPLPTSWTTGPVPIVRVVNDNLHVTASVSAGFDTERKQLAVSSDVTVDRTPPVLSVATPAEMFETVDAAGKATFRIGGTTSDERSAVIAVETAVGGGQFTAAVPKASGDWSQWTAAIEVPQAGQYQLAVRASDQEGNVSPATLVTLNAQETFQPRDPADVFGSAAYLDDLLRFVRQRFSDAAEAAIDADKLKAVYRQRFGELTHPENNVIATELVHQSRICVEVLRALLTAAGKPLPQTDYVRSAYDSLLGFLGTSVDEIRRARGDEAARSALATRLGLDRPDRLDNLFLAPADMTEVNLEKLFGLMDTGRDLLVTGLPPQPLVLTWQLARLGGQWQSQDNLALVHGDVPAAVIDPDMLGADDIRNQHANDAAFALWLARTGEVADDLAAIKNLQNAQSTPLGGLDAIVGQFVAKIDELQLLLGDYRRGVDIGSRLTKLRLSVAAFLRLMRTRELAANGSLLDADWPDVYAIVAYAKKIGRYPAWRAEEQQHAIVLGPDYFSVSPVSPDLPEWRTSPQTRRAWVATLQARIDEEQAARDALAQVVDAAEEATLPTLRDHLIPAVDAINPAQPARSLLIDLNSGPARKTTRLAQAVETLQGVPFAVRVGGFLPNHPAAGWKLNLNNYSEALFDEDWVWWGSHETWHAALRVFIYPTSLLSPTQRSDASPAFVNLIKAVRAVPALSPEQARDAATAYLKEIRPQVAGLPSDFALTEHLTDDQLGKRQDLCKTLFGTITDPHQAPAQLRELFYYAPLLLAQQLYRSGEYLAALDWYQTVYAYHLPKRKIYYGLVLEESIPTKFERLPEWPRKDASAPEILAPHDVVRARARALTRFTVISLVQSFAAFGDAEFTRDSDESIARARTLYESALDVLDQEFGSPEVPDPTLRFGPDPVVDGLRARVHTNLRKLRLGRNIAGLQRAAPAGDTAIAPRQPTPYRFAALIARAKELTQLAGQTESAMLAALEKRDAEAYNLLKARQDIELARENVKLHGLRVEEAQDGVALARLQGQRADIQVNHFDELLDAGTSALEYLSMGAQTAAAFAGGFVQEPVSPAAIVSGSLSAIGSIFGGISSQERREEEWRFQLDLARQDVRLSIQQAELARDQVGIAGQELISAGIQAAHAAATADFLARKFTSRDLYEFMSEILAGVYRYLLQQAAATAKLAEDQLAFERQQPSRSIIKGDYWEVPVDGIGRHGGDPADRGGVTGAARLLADIVDLDQHAFFADRRRLQLTKTISLSRLDPIAFERFRASGVIVFGTPESLFDEGFPGHYVRLIKQMRVSLVALTSPLEGIRAMLTSSGSSRTVVGDAQGFRTVAVQRDPETVAFSAAREATGMFTLLPDAHPDLLRPFEGSGVDAIWRLELPKPANQFDYSTLADVIIECDYEALHSPDYRQQVIQRMSRDRSAERPYSFRQELPDQWYDLHNPDQTATPMTVQFSTGPADYPPNLDDIVIEHVALYFVGADLSEVQLHLAADSSSQAVGGTADPSFNGLISTRRPNGTQWLPITGRPPYGTWTLTLTDSPETRALFAHEQVSDILLDITYASRLPDWPL